MSSAMEKYHSYQKLPADLYWELHKDFLTPTSLSIDLDNFYNCINIYKNYFKPWGNNRPELNDIRLGLPLVNLHGKYDDLDDVSIGPLDQYNKANLENPLLENDFTVPTEILDHNCFNHLNIIKDYMCRSSILYWKNGANFLPHYDVLVPTVNLRLWGTNDPTSVSLRVQRDGKMVEVAHTAEPGRLYLIETSTIHDAACVGDQVYQFFLALNIFSYDTIKGLLNV
jgi:hypothetical protein